MSLLCMFLGEPECMVILPMVRFCTQKAAARIARPSTPDHPEVLLMTYDEAIRNWWVLIVRGVAAIIFGFIALVWPDVTLTFLIILFAVYALFDGAAAIAAGFST